LPALPTEPRGVLIRAFETISAFLRRLADVNVEFSWTKEWTFSIMNVVGNMALKTEPFYAAAFAAFAGILAYGDPDDDTIGILGLAMSLVRCTEAFVNTDAGIDAVMKCLLKMLEWRTEMNTLMVMMAWIEDFAETLSVRPVTQIMAFLRGAIL
jgi:hypothetical protein